MNLPPWRETTRTRTEVFVKVPKLDQREDLQFNKRWFPLPNDVVEVFWVEFNDDRRRCSRSKRCLEQEREKHGEGWWLCVR